MTVQTKSSVLSLGFMFLGVCGGNESSIRVLADRDTNGVRSTVIISTGPITVASLKQIYLTHAPSNPGALSVTKVFPNANISQKILSGKIATDLGYLEWIQQYDQVLKEGRFDMGEIIQVGSDILVRSSYAGQYEQEVISGTNPMRCGSGNGDCEVIWIDIGGIPPLKADRQRRPIIDLYVKMRDLPDSRHAATLARNLRVRFDTGLLNVSFRTDDWFIRDLGFPVYYPFKTSLPAIRKGDIDVDREVLCVSTEKGFRC